MKINVFSFLYINVSCFMSMTFLKDKQFMYSFVFNLTRASNFSFS